jgi:hypothetical protein
MNEKVTDLTGTKLNTKLDEEVESYEKLGTYENLEESTVLDALGAFDKRNGIPPVYEKSEQVSGGRLGLRLRRGAQLTLSMALPLTRRQHSKRVSKRGGKHSVRSTSIVCGFLDSFSSTAGTAFLLGTQNDED